MHDLAIAVAALEQCEANGNSASVAVFDRARRWRVFLQADNANPHNLESVGNETIGVLGVSGSSSEGDERCAMAGIATVADQLRWEPLRRTRTCFECTAAPGVTVCSVSISAAWTTPDWSNIQAGTKERAQRLWRRGSPGVTIAAN